MSEYTAIVVHWEATGATGEEAMRAVTSKLDEVIPGETEVIVLPSKLIQRFKVGFVYCENPDAGYASSA